MYFKLIGLMDHALLRWSRGAFSCLLPRLVRWCAPLRMRPTSLRTGGLLALALIRSIPCSWSSARTSTPPRLLPPCLNLCTPLCSRLAWLFPCCNAATQCKSHRTQRSHSNSPKCHSWGWQCHFAFRRRTFGCNSCQQRWSWGLKFCNFWGWFWGLP